MITSTTNPIVKTVLNLREARERRASGLFIIDGAREVGRAAQCGIAVDQVVYCPDLAAPGTDIKRIAVAKTSVIQVNDKVFSKMAYGDRHDGVLAVARMPQRHLNALKLPDHPFIVVIESVEKPGNLGAIARTCDGAGVDLLLICDPKIDIYNPNVIRASTGAVFQLPCIALSSADAAAFLTQNKIPAVGAFPNAKELYTKADLKGPIAIVLGTEDTGLSPFWQKQCTRKVKIPMHGLADSLNVSVSAAILIYEALRQR